MKKRIGLLAALCLIPLPHHAMASPNLEKPNSVTTMPEVVVTATRSPENVDNIPAKVEVITRQDIEETAGDTLTEQLKKNASIGVIEYPGALAGIGIRGFRPEYSGITKHSLVLINGRPAGATNLATILSDNIDHIEVLKGPASSLYGGEAMGGVVNLITKKNTGKLTGSAEAGFGSFATNYQKAAIGGGLADKIDFDFSAKRYEQADDFRMGDGDTRAHTSYKTRNGNMRLGINLPSDWRFDISGALYNGRDIETPGDIFNGDETSGSKDIDRYGVDISAGGQLGRNNRVSITAYQTNETSENYKTYTGWGPYTQVASYRSYDSETNWQGIQLKDEYNWGQHRFITGVDYQNIDVEARSYNQDGSRKAPWSPDEGRRNWAGYLETVWKLMDKHLTATVGGRYDTFDVETKSTPYKTDFTPNSESFSTFSPRAGINYLFDQGVRLHSTIGKAFVPPTAAQLAGYSEKVFGSTTYITKGNPDLNPESSVTYDLGMGYDLPRSGLSLDLTYFHTKVNDKISSITSGTITTYENSLDARMAGLETMLSFDLGAPLNWERSLTLFVNSTHMFKAEEEQSDGTMKDIHNVAKYTVNYGLKYDDGAVDGKLNCRTQGRMKDTDWNAAGYPEIEYPSFTVVDLVMGYQFKKHHHLSLKIDNLLDHNYYEKKGYPKPGRGIFAGYRYEF
jgi:vitamin B12 transporter